MTTRTIENRSTVRFLNLLCVLLYVGIFLVSCNQASTDNLATSQTSSLLTPQNQSPDAVDGLVRGSGIAPIYADTDGNGVEDRIERCGPTAICIYLIDNEGKESPRHTYNNPDWATASIEQVVNIDTLPGDEVIVQTTKVGGNFGSVSIISARDHSMTSHENHSWFSVAIETLSDTDGDPGLEIILSVRNEQGEFQCICVVHPHSGSYETYSDAEWKAVTIQSQGDTDGLPGEELILDVRDGGNSLVCVCVIHDRSTTTVAYRDSVWISQEVNSEVNSIVDTDGLLGAEIILVFRGLTTAGVSVIHDKTKELNVYQFSDVIVETISERDPFPGSEICILVPTSHKHFVLRDRTKEQEIIETCA